MRSSSPVAEVTLATGANAGPFEDRNRVVGIVIGETLARVGLNEVFGLGRQDGTIVEYDEAGGTIKAQMLVDFLAAQGRVWRRRQQKRSAPVVGESVPSEARCRKQVYDGRFGDQAIGRQRVVRGTRGSVWLGLGGAAFVKIKK